MAKLALFRLWISDCHTPTT